MKSRDKISTELWSKIKGNKKFLIFIAVFILLTILFWYLTIPLLIIWWFFWKSKLTKKAKIAVTSVVGGVIILLVSYITISYAKDVQPSLKVEEPVATTTVTVSEVTIKGQYEPKDRNVWINGKKIVSSGGQFETKFQLNEGSNKIKVETGKWKRVKVELLVVRELTEEEHRAKQEAERKEAESKPSPSQFSPSPHSTSGSASPSSVDTKTHDYLKQLYKKMNQATEDDIIVSVDTENGFIQATHQDDGSWIVIQIVNSWPEVMVDFSLKSIARNFIYEVYHSGYTIKQAGITINGPSHKYFRIFVGFNQVKNLSEDDWKYLLPTNFYNWVKQVETSREEPDRSSATFIEESS